MQRIYESIIQYHLMNHQQMAFLSGPRQVGKTTIARNMEQFTDDFKYLNWDKSKDREQILKGEEAAVQNLPIHTLKAKKPMIVFDEIHKYKYWRMFLKGFIDEYKGLLNVIVTGSSKLDVFRRSGDSLMGRYFLYRVHPFSVGELLRTSLPKNMIAAPEALSQEKFEALFEFGGFPEPLFKQNKKFYNQWQNLRLEKLIHDDIRDLAQVHEIAQLEILAEILKQQASQLLEYNSISKKVRVADQTIRRWIGVLEAFYYCFTIKPWSTNISRSLIKQPKVYLWDWSLLEDKGKKIENFVAAHLLKAVHFWTDIGFGKYELYFLRDKEKREVDFLITENKKPWILIEVKSSMKESMQSALYRFGEALQVPHVFQVAFDAPYIEEDVFSLTKPTIIPLKTFLSQLI